MAITASMVKELREKTGAGMLDCKKALTENDGDINKSIDWLREKGISKAAKKADRIAAEGLCGVVVEGNKAVVYEVNSETDFVAKNEKFTDLVAKLGQVLVSSEFANIDEALNLNVDGKTVADLLTESTATIGEKISLRNALTTVKTDAQVFGAYSHMGGRIVSLTVLEGSDEVAKDVAMHVAAINPKYLSENDIEESVLEAEKKALVAEIQNDPKMANKPAQVIEKNILPGRINKFKKEICLLDQPFVKDSDFTVGKYVSDKKSSVVSFKRLEVGEGIEKKEEDFASEVMSQIKA